MDCFLSHCCLLCRIKRPYEGFKTGFMTGFAAFIGIIYWIAYVVVLYGYLPLPVGIAVMMLLSAYLALYVALFAAGIVYFHKRGGACLLLAATAALDHAGVRQIPSFNGVSLGEPRLFPVSFHASDPGGRHHRRLWAFLCDCSCQCHHF